MRFQHSNARAKCVIKTVPAGLDPEQHSNDGQVKEENDVRHAAGRKRDCNNRGAAGDRPVRRHVQPLPPHHDSPQFAPIKMRHRIDVARVVNAPLQRNCTFLFMSYGCILSRHNLLFYWITAFAAYSNKSLHPLMPIALADLLTEQQVILRLSSRKAANAIREIVDVLASDVSGRKIAKSEAFLEQVLACEQRHPSVVENGVAFPHARTDLVDEIVIGVGRSRAGIPFGENQHRAHLIFVIGVPERLVSDYLVCVGTLARLVNDEMIRSRLLSAETAREFVEALTTETV